MKYERIDQMNKGGLAKIIQWRYLMNKDKEPKSLLEVREWKEKCRLRDEHLTHDEYIRRIKENTDRLLQNYNLKLKHLPNFSLGPG
jgi:hypothetical protein